MANSYKVEGIASYGHHKFTVNVTQLSSSAVSNTSEISYSVVLSPVVEGYDWNYTNIVPVEGMFSILDSLHLVAGEDIEIMSYDGSSNYTIASGTATVYHADDGSCPLNISLMIASKVSASYMPGGLNLSEQINLESITREAYFTSAPNFNDEQNPTIQYINPMGNSAGTLQACISLTGARADIAYRNINKTGGSYTFNLTDAERDILRNATNSGKNYRTVYFIIATTIDGTTYRKSMSKRFTVVNAAPTLSPNIYDSGTVSKTLTGDQNIIIKGYNNIHVYTGATAYKGATIISQSITNGDKIVNSNYARFDNTESADFVITATDSRGNTINQTVSKTLIPYVPLTASLEANIELSATNATTAKASFKVSGNYFKGSFGATENALTLTYTLKGSNDSEYTGTLTVPEETLAGGYYVVNTSIDNLDYRYSYILYLDAADKITTLAIQSKTLRAYPVFDWGENDFNFNVPVTVEGRKCYAPYVLFEGNTRGTVTLNDSIANYDYIEILFTDNNSKDAGSVKLCNLGSSSQTINLSLTEASTSASSHIRRTAYICYGNTLTPQTTSAGYLYFSGTTVKHTSGTNYIAILKVLGYK